MEKKNFLSDFKSFKIQIANAIANIGHLIKNKEYAKVSLGSMLIAELKVRQKIKKAKAKQNHLFFNHSQPIFLYE